MNKKIIIFDFQCIALEGRGYRVECRKLGKIRKRFPDIPIMTLTCKRFD